VITDLSRCLPRSALSDMVQKRKHWKVIPYRFKNGCEGKMIWAPPEANAPEVSLALEAEGWYAIFVGVFSTSEVPSTTWLRLDTDPASVPRYNSCTDYYGNSEEIFFAPSACARGTACCSPRKPRGRLPLAALRT
jgi:hypothetical protein